MTPGSTKLSTFRRHFAIDLQDFQAEEFRIMNKERSIFEPQEGFAAPPKSPFATDDRDDSPFASPAPESKSPFSEAVGVPADGGSGSKSPFGYEPPMGGGITSPFGEAATPVELPPAKAAEPKPEASPFGLAEDPAPALPAPGAPVGATDPVGLSEPVRKPEPPKPSSWDPAPAEESDSCSIRQLELRAIFGVDRELSESEILQRARSLPGIRQLSRVAGDQVGTVDAMKRLIKGLGFGEGQVKLYCGSAPIDFVREGPVLLAVQTDGGFAPGIRETLIIVARELAKL
jgi:hypothetical protein